MYYSVSDRLISRHPGDQNDLIAMDRAIARSYASDGHAWIDDGILTLRTGLPRARVRSLARRYVNGAILESYTPVQCPLPCEELYDPLEETCPACDKPATDANPTSQERYRVISQPSEPVFDPSTASGPFTVFISYRHGDTTRLAADLYYSLTKHGIRVFLDDGHIPLGVNFERVFLPAASETPFFISLVSPRYFESDYCKREIAHALRAARSVILAEVGTRLSNVIPVEMPWLARLNPSPKKGNSEGLSGELEEFLLSQVKRRSEAPRVYDFQLDACRFLLSRLGPVPLTRLINSLGWLDRINTHASLDEQVQSVIREVQTDTTKLLELSAALRP